jgi:hypothetical protein
VYAGGLMECVYLGVIGYAIGDRANINFTTENSTIVNKKLINF